MATRQKKITESFRETKARIKVTENKKVSRKIFEDENTCQSPSSKIDRKIPVQSVSVSQEEPENYPFYLAKKALHSSIPETLPRRETEIKEVREFITKHLSARTAGSLYISGAPGTGKTSVVTYVLEKLQKPDEDDVAAFRFVTVFINCKSSSKPVIVLEDIARQCNVRRTQDDIKDDIVKRITSKAAKPIVLILDEMDQLLVNASKELLQILFDWTRVPGSKLILIGIANALDLTVRHLPKFFSSPKSTARKTQPKKNLPPPSPCCQSMNFSPYEREDIALILQDRLKNTTRGGNQLFDPAAIKFVAMKVAATTGDMRKALSACKLAIQSMEKDNGRSPLKRSADDGLNSSTPKKQCFQGGETIGVAAVAKLLCPQKTEDLPLQQAVILATLLRINRRAPGTKAYAIDGVLSPIPFDTIYAEHHKICSKGSLSRIESSDIPSYCAQLQDRSLLTIVEDCPSSGSRKKGFGKTNKSSGVIFDPRAAENVLRSVPHLKVVMDC